jgi:DNA-binding transcriptional MerR regulator|tara:strand:- start:123 stop:314 length:192 start_codon:yes stop_codon:yes gene_type:complete
MEVLFVRTAGQLCRELGIRYYRLDYLIRSGYVPEPMRLNSGQRLFMAEDIERLMKVIYERTWK